MAIIALGLILGAVSMFGGRGIILNIKGRILKVKLDINPVWLQMFATIFVVLSYIYMTNAIGVLEAALLRDRYVSESGPSLDFLLGSVAALAISTIMTAAKFLKDDSKEENSKEENNKAGDNISKIEENKIEPTVN